MPVKGGVKAGHWGVNKQIAANLCANRRGKIRFPFAWGPE